MSCRVPRKNKVDNCACVRAPYFGFLPAAARALAWRLPLAPLPAPVRGASCFPALLLGLSALLSLLFLTVVVSMLSRLNCFGAAT